MTAPRAEGAIDLAALMFADLAMLTEIEFQVSPWNIRMIIHRGPNSISGDVNRLRFNELMSKLQLVGFTIITKTIIQDERGLVMLEQYRAVRQEMQS